MEEQRGPMSFDLADFNLANMLRCGRGIRRAAQGASSISGAADTIVRYLYTDSGTLPDGRRTCALVRCYRTMAYGSLDRAQRAFADGLMRVPLASPDMKCLTLVATVGDEAAWCSPATSRGHRVIPLPSPEIVEQAPMIAQLIRQMGLDIDSVVRPQQDIIPALAGRTYNVFHVEQAVGSPYIPAQQDFVVPYGVRSVVGFGGLLRSGDLFSVIMFSRLPITEESAGRFRTIGLDVKAAFFRFED